MKKPLLLMLIFLPVFLLAHRVYQKEMAEIIRDADLVMTAKVTMATTTGGTCEKGYEYQLSPEQILKGEFTGQRISFNYSVYFWDEKKGCPSVHYILPPVPQNLTRGKMVVAVFKKHEAASGGFRGTGLFDINDRDAVIKLIDKGAPQNPHP